MTDRARGFVDIGDLDRYVECEAAVNEVLKNIKRLAPRFKVRFLYSDLCLFSYLRTMFFFFFTKNVLAKSKYYEAIGSVTDAALSRVLQDVLELSDIPELESHRLSELCRILNALEGLFCEDSEHVRKCSTFVTLCQLMLTGYLNRFTALLRCRICAYMAQIFISL